MPWPCHDCGHVLGVESCSRGWNVGVHRHLRGIAMAIQISCFDVCGVDFERNSLDRDACGFVRAVSLMNWYRYVYKAELKLTAPFDPRKLSLICRPYIGPRGLERKFIQLSTFPDDKGMVYDGTSVTWVDQTPGGDDEMHVWTLVKGVRKELRVYSGGEDARW